jgi:anti-sigma28 factor (negative regulator of flagellin synthesis)
VKTARERAEEKRQEKLEYIRQQIESGALVIRQMTEAERRLDPPRPRLPKRWAR